MNDEKLQELAEKVVKGQASQEEKDSFIKEFNSLLSQLNQELKK